MTTNPYKNSDEGIAAQGCIMLIEFRDMRLRSGMGMRHGLLTMSFDQGQFDFDAPGSDAGWRRWREELDEKKRAFESRWGVVLGKQVTVWLKDHAKPLSGMIEWLEPAKAGNEKNGAPRFRLRGLEFGVGEIESIVQQE